LDTIAAIAWGLINFGLLLWMPNDFVSTGFSMGFSSKLLAESALIAFSTVFLCAYDLRRLENTMPSALRVEADP